jgi:hypothetical protein
LQLIDELGRIVGGEHNEHDEHAYRAGQLGQCGRVAERAGLAARVRCRLPERDRYGDRRQHFPGRRPGH